MNPILCTFVPKLVVFAAVSLPPVPPPLTHGLSPTEAVALNARFEPSLGALRAGRTATQSPLGATERTELASAQQNSASLAALRAGFQPSDREWSWMAIGAIVVLLIIVL